ncbi:FAD-dependent oxidoreductase [Amycolatopsis sp. NPDC051071]|uniref:FAD-dependent oxidoreductase n=1 Tax=Amycolatopsis sp. NPDC051071 TaxID=3154637 RepID=UPI0034485E1A
MIGTGVVGLAAAHALLARGLTVTVLGPRPAGAAGQGSAPAGAMLSPFSEVDASQPEARVELEVGQRLKAFARYPAWLDELAAASRQPPIPLVPGTWVVATAAERDDLAAIARAAHGATHPAEPHHSTDHTGLAQGAESAAALWLPTEPSLDITRLLLFRLPRSRTPSASDGSSRRRPCPPRTRQPRIRLRHPPRSPLPRTRASPHPRRRSRPDHRPSRSEHGHAPGHLPLRSTDPHRGQAHLVWDLRRWDEQVRRRGVRRWHYPAVSVGLSEARTARETLVAPVERAAI